MLKREELLKMFEAAGAIRHGHFELTSGLHSGTYVQCALVLQYPRFAEKLGQALAALFSDARIDAVVSDRKSTRLNSSHLVISYAVFCLKKKTHLHTHSASVFH